MDDNVKPLWKHQEQGVWSALTQYDTQGLVEMLIAFEIGTGKTRTMIEIIRHICARNERLMRILIVVPKKVRLNWKREIEKYSKIHPRDVVILGGSGKRRTKDFIDACAKNYQLREPKIIITNYESFEMEELFTLFVDWNPEIMVCDEAHKLKNPDSKRAKKIIQLADKVPNKFALTGTPILNTALDIFNLYRYLDGGKTFGVNYWKFRNVWFEDENARWSGKPGHFAKWVPRPEAYAEFTDMIYKKAVRALKSECLDLPPFVREEVHVEMSPEQARLYREMKEEYIAYIDDITKTDTPRAVVAQLAITKAQRLMQILTGYAKTEDGEIHRIKVNPRLDALEEIFEDYAADHKIIVWSIYHENYADIKALCEKMKLGFSELHGKTKADPDKEIDRFNTDPTCRVIIANQQAGGEGVNLTASDLSVFYSKNFSWGQDEQSEGRNYRGGSEIHEKITRIDITVPGTIDELISEALETKARISEKILDWRDRI